METTLTALTNRSLDRPNGPIFALTENEYTGEHTGDSYGSKMTGPLLDQQCDHKYSSRAYTENYEATGGYAYGARP